MFGMILLIPLVFVLLSLGSMGDGRGTIRNPADFTITRHHSIRFIAGYSVLPAPQNGTTEKFFRTVDSLIAS
jgi:hypothetical protein